jgi:hypothetical protein
MTSEKAKEKTSVPKNAKYRIGKGVILKGD